MKLREHKWFVGKSKKKLLSIIKKSEIYKNDIESTIYLLIKYYIPVNIKTVNDLLKRKIILDINIRCCRGFINESVVWTSGKYLISSEELEVIIKDKISYYYKYMNIID